MQLLTNAFFLPYLATRSSESGEVVYRDEFDGPEALVWTRSLEAAALCEGGCDPM